MSNSKTKERDLDNMNENYCVYGIEFYDIDCSKPSHKEYLYTINDNKHRNTNNEITWMLGRWDGKKYKDNFVKAYNEGVHSYWKNNDDLRQWSVRLGMLTQEQVDRIRLGKKLTDAELLDIQRKVLNGELKNPAELPSNEYTGSIDAEGKNNSRILFNEGDINSITTNRYERNREARE